MAENQKMKDGLIPVQIVRKDGVSTTVYKRPEDLSASERKNLPKNLAEKSFLQKEEKPFDMKDMEFRTESSAVDFITDLTERPEEFHKPEVRAKTADALTLLAAKKAAAQQHKDDLKKEITGFFTEKQIKNGEFKTDTEDKMDVQVVEELGRFNADRAGLTMAEKAKCEETGPDTNELQRLFPETWDEIGRCTGEAYVVPDTSTEAYKQMKSKFAEQSKARSDKRVGSRRKQSDVISELRKARQMLERIDMDYNEARGMVSDVAFDESMKDSFSGKRPSKGKEIIDSTYGESTTRNQKSGCGLTMKPNVTHDSSEFRDARFEHHADRIAARDLNSDEATIMRKARARANVDWSRVTTLKVRADLVKKNFPKKYEKGRMNRELYVYE